MTAEEMWEASGLTGTYETWAFGSKPDELAKLVVEGIKTATCSGLVFYEEENEPLPQEGEYSVILDADDHAVCIIQTTKVYLTAFREVTDDHAFKEGEGDRTLTYWRKVHTEFFSEELASINQEFSEDMKLVCEEFKVVYR